MLVRHAQLLQEQKEVISQLTNFGNERRKLQAEHAMANLELGKKQKVIPVLKQRVDALDRLQQKSYGSKLQYLELKQELIEEQQDYLAQQERLAQIQGLKDSIETQKALYLAERRKQTLAELNTLQVQQDAISQRVLKAEQRVQHFMLTAPVSGQVQQIAVTTVDGVVRAAQPLMQIVPNDSALEVEAMILNKDIGFVREGQRVAVKVGTFNFTKYGMLQGTIRHLSDDAISRDADSAKPELVYAARIALDKDALLVENKNVRLSPGMAITAEIKTGQRRLIEFFLSPLLRYKQESLGER